MSPSRSPPQYWLQSIKIEGIESLLFAQTIDAVLSVHAHFQSHLRTSEISPWRAVDDCIHITNRVFTKASPAYESFRVPFEAHVDSNGQLQATAELRSLVHLEDNSVKFSEQRIEEDRIIT